MPSEISGKTSSDIENVDWSVCTGLPTVVRFGSSSSHTSQSSGDICRICHCENDPQNPLLTPCYCSGSLKYVHQACLQQWLTASATNSCELCKFPFIMHTKIKPFNEWRSLDMSGVERRRLFCSVLFHCAAALCVIWSLCVLIERAAEEVKRGLIGWPFWTKLVVVTVGLTGGVVFMYIQCRQYLHLCNRLRARNRIILIQNAPEKVHPPHSPIIPVRNLPQNSSSSMTGIGINNNSNTNNYIRQQQQQQFPNQQQQLNPQQQQQLNQQQLQGQIIANIENNPLHYERDWTLDDISQVSFKPCPQGSGSLTPLAFHDSVHNIYEQQHQQQQQLTTKITNSSNNSSHNSSNEHIFNQIIPNETPTTTIQTSVTPTAITPTPSSTSTPRTNDLSLFKIGSDQLKCPNSAVFIENRDILNDASYPKLYHRHSTILQTPDNIQDNFNKIINKDIRRYSDTKLLQQQQKQLINNNSNNSNNQIIFNVTNILGPTIQTTTDNNIIINNQPQITDIIFESSGQNNFDPLELNIQEMLELDIKTQQLERKSQLSLNQQQIYTGISSGSTGIDDDNYSGGGCSSSGSGVNKNIFKSLPNLSGSSENLLQ